MLGDGAGKEKQEARVTTESVDDEVCYCNPPLTHTRNECHTFLTSVCEQLFRVGPPEITYGRQFRQLSSGRG